MYSAATPKSPLVVEQSTTSILAGDSKALTSNSSSLMEKVEEWYSLVKQTDQEIRTIYDQVKEKDNRLQEEMNFISEYFHSCWKVEQNNEVCYYDDRLKDVVSFRDALEERQTNIKQKKRKLSDSQDSLDPIVYFNVEGEIFTILRSTILRVIPKSQLAVRVSGRWEEQASKGDIDEEGNLVVNCHKESFKQILSALQICGPANKLFVIYVHPICKDYIEETLDYLSIVPDLITTIEKSF
jgi:vacuolar-type H+-ATPase subunit I/STV1